MVIPFFVTSLLWMSVVCVVLMASPWLLRGLEL